MRRPGWGQYEQICQHEQTTAPDHEGFVVCCSCLLAVRRPLTQDELNRKLLER